MLIFLPLAVTTTAAFEIANRKTGKLSQWFTAAISGSLIKKKKQKTFTKFNFLIFDRAKENELQELHEKLCCYTAIYATI